MRNVVLAGLSAILLHSAASAQTAPAPPDPATIPVPDLSRSGDPQVVANGWKYFFFRKEGVSFAEAHADLLDCMRFQAPNSWANVQLDRFVPWDSSANRRTVRLERPYGLVGQLMGDLFEGTLTRRDYQAKMRRCMEPRGYTRYGVPEDVWDKVRKMAPEAAIAVQARIASGPDFGGKVPDK